MWSPKRRVRLPLGALVLAGMLGAAALTYATGGTQLPFLHVMYLPIGLAAVLFGPPGGLAAAVGGGLLLGPLMPLDVSLGTPQPLGGWLFRLALFALNGLVLGAAGSLLRHRLTHVERLGQTLGQVYARNLRLFAGLVAERDELTAGHCERVAQNAIAIGRRLALDERDLGQLYWSGLLHDLGKIGVPEAILRKPGPLTPIEYEQMKRHANLGHEILLSVSDAFDAIATGVHAHHERWDGTGYPRRLAAQDIPIFGRIIAVADVFEAVTSERSYRHPMPLADALALLREGSGNHFDPAVVDAFFDAYDAGQITRQADPTPLYDSFIMAVASQRVNVVDLPELR